LSRSLGGRAIASVLVAARAIAAEPSAGDERLESTRTTIERLRRELDSLEGQERSLLGELERLDRRLQLRQAEVEEIRLRIAAADRALRAREADLRSLESRERQLERYLFFRLREHYKRGSLAPIAPLLAGIEPTSSTRNLAFVAGLLERDARSVRALREARAAAAAERDALLRQRAELDRLQREATAALERLREVREDRRRHLARLKLDRGAREGALQELEAARQQLERLVKGFEPAPAVRRPDVTRFRGLLDWPVEGRVARKFGFLVHPRFGTELPHPGLDIEAPEGTPFRSVFEGRVLFASWLRGYGLTVIVDHGHGLASVYAHASALFVETGSEVHTGQVLGRVGDTGSLRGPRLYFELREKGRPVDPLPWLRPRERSGCLGARPSVA